MSEKTSENNMLDRLGIKQVINGMSWVTILGGSIMAPEVLQAMVEVADCYGGRLLRKH
jgi:seryl-tRNA(Sec) selenium transferase